MNVKRSASNKPYVTLKILKLVHSVVGYFLVFQQKMPRCCYLCLHKGLNASEGHRSPSVSAETADSTEDGALRKGLTMPTAAPLLCHQRYEHEAGP